MKNVIILLLILCSICYFTETKFTSDEVITFSRHVIIHEVTCYPPRQVEGGFVTTVALY